MASEYNGTISSSPVEQTGFVNGTELLLLSGPGLYLDMDNSNEAGAANWQQVHANRHGGAWRGPMIGTRLRLRKDPGVSSVTVRLIGL